MCIGKSLGVIRTETHNEVERTKGSEKKDREEKWGETSLLVGLEHIFFLNCTEKKRERWEVVEVVLE